MRRGGRTRTARGVWGAALLVVLLGPGTPAQAAEHPLALDVTPAGGPTGARISVAGEEATPGGVIRLFLVTPTGDEERLPPVRADRKGEFRSAFLLPDLEDAEDVHLRACEDQEKTGCTRKGQASLRHHGPASLRAVSGRRSATLHLEQFAEPSACGSVLIHRGTRKVDQVVPRGDHDGGPWSASVDLALPPGVSRLTAEQTGRGCEVVARAEVWSYDVWVRPDRPVAGRPVVVHGAGFRKDCLPVRVSLADEAPQDAVPDGEGSFALEVAAPAKPGTYELVVARSRSTSCDPLRLVMPVDVVAGGGVSSSSSSAAPSASAAASASAAPTASAASTASAGSTSSAEPIRSAGATPIGGMSRQTGGTTVDPSPAPPASPSAHPSAPGGVGEGPSAAAPSLTVATAAPAPGELLPVSGTGWLPGVPVVLALDDEPVSELPARADGTISTAVGVSDEAPGVHRLFACQRCESLSPLRASAAFEVPADGPGLHPALALLVLLPAAAARPAYRERQRRLAHRVSLVPRRAEPRLRLTPPSGPPGRSVRLAPRSVAPTVRLREAPP